MLCTADVTKLAVREKLQLLRDNAQRPKRQPEVVLLCATDVLARSSTLSDIERYNLTETAIIAAVDLGQDAKATELFRGLVRKFGSKSVRVRRLQGMLLEAAGKTDNAMEVYRGVLGENPTDPFVARRLCALHRAGGDYRKAAAALESTKVYRDPKEKDREFSYAELHGSDEAAARELVSLYWLMGNVPKCVYYADETVFLDPHNYLHHNRVAEMCYAAGLYERSATSYAQSLRLNDAANNVRAMYGLWLVAQRIAANTRGAAQTHGVAKDAPELVKFAKAKLTAAYGSSPTLSYLDLTMQLRD